MDSSWIPSILQNLIANAIWVFLAAIGVFFFGRWRGWWLRRKAGWERGSADPTRFAILVADLDGDVERAQSRHVLQTLRTKFAEAIFRCRALWPPRRERPFA